MCGRIRYFSLKNWLIVWIKPWLFVLTSKIFYKGYSIRQIDYLFRGIRYLFVRINIYLCRRIFVRTMSNKEFVWKKNTMLFVRQIRNCSDNTKKFEQISVNGLYIHDFPCNDHYLQCPNETPNNAFLNYCLYWHLSLNNSLINNKRKKRKSLII